MPGGGFQVEPEELRGYSGLLERSNQHFQTIKQHASDKGGDTSGFTGLLSLLVPIVDGIIGLYTDALQSAGDKLAKVQTNLDSAAESYEKREAGHTSTLNTVAGKVDSAKDAPTLGGAA
ncbi:hypothetical protein CFN78_23370 [Amycolatopsis antarctica]|uniref:ESX-1 secretion-associated protein n=1 Tax=Amycolatopsis antarctica TaxID=1854586 RepID=A0A263CXI4_9PSEU|nr:hypothetical protein [Amycolatopsis antarctica]OZM70854.1 hypothetical protein CFN78_23370 [Amycolatopsis antarctica]